MEIYLNGEPFEANADNTRLYHWAGELSCFTHVFIETFRNEELKQIYGGFVWCDETAFTPLNEAIIEHEWPMHLNQRPRDLRQTDIDQWHEKHAHDLDEIDGVPEEWNGNAA